METVGDRPAVADAVGDVAADSPVQDPSTLAGHGTTAPQPARALPVEAFELPAHVMETVWAVVSASTLAAATAAHQSDWAQFQRWATAGGHAALPASPMVVAAYLTGAADKCRSDGRPQFGLASLMRWTSSINQVHTAAGLPAPGRSEVVRRALSAVRRSRKLPPKPGSSVLLPNVHALLTAMAPAVTAWPAAMAAHRDTALLLLGFAGVHQRSELVGLRVSDVTVHPADGLHVRVRSPLADEEKQTVVCVLPRGQDLLTCLPCALIRWRRLLLAYNVDDAGQPAAVLQLRHRSLSTEHVCWGIDDIPAAAVAGHDAEPFTDRDSWPDAARTVGERWLFPTIHKSGHASPKAMSGDAVAMMIRRRAAAAGFIPTQIDLLGGRSLRTGSTPAHSASGIV